MLSTEFEFILPRGFLNADGQLHRQGTMRLATAMDELMMQKDRRVQDQSAYSTLVLLSQVIVRLGTLSQVLPEQLERLFTQDLAYLREFYNRVNQQGHALIATECPHCATTFKTELVLSGES
ncbi:MAG: phage tail assembly protein [Cyanobacteria bacterium P01_F01_bin.56]